MEMFNLVRELEKKNQAPYVLEDLKNMKQEQLLKFRSKDKSNIVHYATYSPAMLEYLYTFAKEYFYELNTKGESPLLKMLSSKQDYPFTQELLQEYKGDDPILEDKMVMSIMVYGKKEYTITILKKKFFLSEQAKNLLYRTHPELFHYIKPKYWDKYNLNYYKAFPKDTEEFLDQEKFSKRDLKILNLLIKDGQCHDFLLNLYILAKKLDLNQDIVCNFIKQNIDIDNFYLYEKEFSLCFNILKKLKKHYRDKRLIQLYLSLATTDLNYYILDSLENLIDETKLKKPKSLYDLYNYYKGQYFLKQQEKTLEEPLDQVLFFLDGKQVDENHYIRVPKTNRDLIQASIKLNICVGWGAYYQKIKDFESQIIFLYRNKQLYACIELLPRKFYQINEIKKKYNLEVDEQLSLKVQNLIDGMIGRFLEK